MLWECDVWQKYSLHYAWGWDDLLWHEMFFTTFFKHDLTNKTKKEKKRRKHTPKKAQEKPIVLTDVSILNKWMMIHLRIFVLP